ncbi:MAG TPA: carboxypeptidase-like regulatory domain-containing protein [Pyrinomonadaceae bacterium]
MTTQRPLLPFALRSLLRTVILFALCTLPFASAHAQSATATLGGTVEDQNGAVVPGVNITVQNTGTSFERQASTNESGSFTIPLLPPGTYTITARRDGFTPVEVRNVTLNVGDQKSLQIQLKAGDVKAEVQVTTDAQLINESPAVGTVIDRQFVSRLPLSGRSFQSLILLTPGVVATASDSSLHPGEFSVNGQRQNANYFTVDGVSANTGVATSPAGFASEFSQQAGGAIPGTTALGTTASLVSIDALEEFKIQTSGYSAEFGRQPGGQVQLVTRSGGNEFHGSAFEYLRNDALDARNYFNKVPQEKSELRQNQFGGTFSGPVMLPRFGEGGKPFWSGRNKTFFFFSYEGQRLRIPVITEGLQVPSLRLRQQVRQNRNWERSDQPKTQLENSVKSKRVYGVRFS